MELCRGALGEENSKDIEYVAFATRDFFDFYYDDIGF